MKLSQNNAHLKTGANILSHVERSFKGAIQSDSIELPFIYTSRLTEKNIIQSVTGPCQYLLKLENVMWLFPVKWHRWNFNPHGAETEYEFSIPEKYFF